MPELMAGAIQDCLPLTRTSRSSPMSARTRPRSARCLTQRGVPAFAAAESCTAALAGHAAGPASFEPPADAPDSRPRRGCGRPADRLARRSAGQAAVRALRRALRRASASSAPRRRPTAAAREFGGRVVLKILSSRDHAQERCRRRGGRPDAGDGRGAADSAWLTRSKRRLWRAPSSLPRAGDGRRRHRADPGHAPRSRSARPSCWAWAASRPNCSRTPRCACCRPQGGLSRDRGPVHGAGAEDLAAARRLPRPARRLMSTRWSTPSSPSRGWRRSWASG